MRRLRLASADVLSGDERFRAALRLHANRDWGGFSRLLAADADQVLDRVEAAERAVDRFGWIAVAIDRERGALESAMTLLDTRGRMVAGLMRDLSILSMRNLWEAFGIYCAGELEMDAADAIRCFKPSRAADLLIGMVQVLIDEYDVDDIDLRIWQLADTNDDVAAIIEASALSIDQALDVMQASVDA